MAKIEWREKAFGINLFATITGLYIVRKLSQKRNV